MDAKLKRKWIHALRSGQYIQGAGQLVSGDGESFCCLGVLADVQGCVWQESVRDDTLVPILPKGRRPFSITGRDSLHPRSVGGLSTPLQQQLIEMNDAGKSFTEIANYIERGIA